MACRHGGTVCSGRHGRYFGACGTCIRIQIPENVLNPKALMIVVSQSGETADTLAALRLAKEKGITTMAIVNVVGSSIAREADKVFYTLAGRRFRWQPRKPIVRSLQQCTAWQCSLPKFVVRSQKSSMVIILPNC